MQIISFREAKTHLSRLLEQTAKTGEGFIITRAGKPVAQLLPLEVAPSAARRRLGFMAGQSSVPEDFDRMAEDEIQAMLNGTP